jgi:hypothetical protein
MTKIKECSIEQIPMGLNVYRKIATTGHTFEPAMFYSFADEARLINTSSMGVRQRAIYDQWPTVSVHVSKGQAKRPDTSVAPILRKYRWRRGIGKKAKQSKRLLEAGMLNNGGG